MEFIRECIHDHKSFFMDLDYIELAAELTGAGMERRDMGHTMQYVGHIRDQCWHCRRHFYTGE